MRKHSIEGFPGYYIYENGQVWSDRAQRFLTAYPNTNQYYIVDILDENHKRRKVYIHRLLGLYFIENDDPINKTQINHKDENRQNNSLDNLEWISLVDNLNYKTAQQRGAKSRQIPVLQLDKNNNIINRFSSCSEACKKVGITPGTLTPALQNPKKTAGGYYWKYDPGRTFTH